MQSIRCTGAFALSVLVWLSGSALGYGIAEWTNSLPEHQQALPEELLVFDTDAMPSQNADEAGVEHTSIDIFLFILSRNVMVYIWLLAGLLSAGIVTFLVLISNGLALGQTLALAAQSGVSAGAIAELLLPHGVLEFGAFCIAGAVGFQGFKLASGRHDWATVKALRLGLVLAFGAVALSVAAGVEAFVTMHLAPTPRA